MAEASKNWTLVDPVERANRNLSDGDVCYYYLTRVPGGFSSSTANNRIDNFKKNPEKYKNKKSVWQYKQQEIERFAEEVIAFLMRDNYQLLLRSFSRALLVPMPTSKPKNHEFHDSRLEELCELVVERVSYLVYENPFDVTEALNPAHFLAGLSACSFGWFSPPLRTNVEKKHLSAIHQYGHSITKNQAYILIHFACHCARNSQALSC